MTLVQRLHAHDTRSESQRNDIRKYKVFAGKATYIVVDEFEDLLETIGKPLEQFGFLAQVHCLIRPPLQNIYLLSSIFPLPP